jgi:hypothetical protein
MLHVLKIISNESKLSGKFPDVLPIDIPIGIQIGPAVEGDVVIQKDRQVRPVHIPVAVQIGYGAQIAVAVSIPVGLIRIGNRRKIVHISTDAILVSVVVRILGLPPVYVPYPKLEFLPFSTVNPVNSAYSWREQLN